MISESTSLKMKKTAGRKPSNLKMKKLQLNIPLINSNNTTQTAQKYFTPANAQHKNKFKGPPNNFNTPQAQNVPKTRKKFDFSVTANTPQAQMVASNKKKFDFAHPLNTTQAQQVSK